MEFDFDEYWIGTLRVRVINMYPFKCIGILKDRHCKILHLLEEVVALSDYLPLETNQAL